MMTVRMHKDPAFRLLPEVRCTICRLFVHLVRMLMSMSALAIYHQFDPVRLCNLPKTPFCRHDGSVVEIAHIAN
jgi:hypothetical protein